MLGVQDYDGVERVARSGRRSFSGEFKADAVALVLDAGGKIAAVARDVGVGESTLGKWVAQARIDRGEKQGLTSEEKRELTVLRRENRQLKMERDLLKRATAFWVKESGQ